MQGVIAALRKEPGRSGRVQVVLRDGSSFALSPAIAGGLRLGQALDAAEVERLQQLDRQERAAQHARRLLSRRPRSERELGIALQRRGLGVTERAIVLERLRQEGWLGDLAFSRAWIDNRQDFRPRSARALRFELKQRGVDPGVIEAALEGYDEGKAAEAAARTGARKYASLPEDLFRRRLAGYLTRRGFDYPTILPLIARLWRERERSPEESEGSP